jgi:hypothetical protein
MLLASVSIAKSFMLPWQLGYIGDGLGSPSVS